MWKPALLTGAGGSLGFIAMGFLYPPLWLGAPGCLVLGLALAVARSSGLCERCRKSSLTAFWG
ncbi:MAG: hypothetical protein RDV00_05460 [Clostridia bacterium]|nr:hypothetical protein [Clostridia bacterium]